MNRPPHLRRTPLLLALLSVTGLGFQSAGCSADAPDAPGAGVAELRRAERDELAELLRRTSELNSPLSDDEQVLVESLLREVLPDTAVGDFAGHEWQVEFNTSFRFFELFLARADDHVPQARVHLRYRSDLTQEELLAWGEDELLYRPPPAAGASTESEPIAFRAIPATKHYFALIGRIELRASARVAQWANPARLKMLLRAFPLEELARF
ncbi:MAG: hypothetical protein CMJ84_07735 [Planctomycetes bacterium]|jgi:hypothetical protein|nr:hypothetical protein [Planctomycetota bacterium]MDP6410286.1 hypothetical protein [Planctomycetota bacterium]